MGLALLIVVLKTIAIKRKDERYNEAARFWARIFAVNFLIGVVTGIPMEFQFGTNWSQFARITGGRNRSTSRRWRESSRFSWSLRFLGLFLFGGEAALRELTWASAFLVFLGSWISGFFIIVTNAWMQHPVAYRVLPNGAYEVTSFWGLLTNPWALLQYAHNMSGAVITRASFMCSVGAFYVLEIASLSMGRNFPCASVLIARTNLVRNPDFSYRRPAWPIHG